MSKDINDTNNDLYSKPAKKKKYGWRYFLCILSGMVLGIGTVAGAAYVVSTSVSTGQVMSAFGKDPNQVLTEQYQQESLYTFITSVINGETDFTTIRGISEVTPLLDTVVDSLGNTLNKYLGVKLSKDEIITLKIEEVPDFLFVKMKKETKIAVVLDINENSNNILKMLAFHKKEDGTYDYDSPRPLSEFSGDNGDVTGGATNDIIAELISTATVSDVLEVKEGDLLYPFKDTKISELEGEIKNTPIKNLITFDENTPTILRALGNYTLNNIADGIKALTVADIFGRDNINQQNSIIQALYNATIVNLNAEVGNLPLSSFITVGDDIPFALSKVLNKTKVDPETGEVRPYTIAEIAECYENLTIGDFIDYSSENVQDNVFFKYIPENTKLDDVPNAMNNLTIGQIFESEIFDENGKVSTKWEYLLHNPDTDASLDSDASNAEKFSGLSIKVNGNLNQLTNNMTKNVSVATVRNLYQHELLKLNDPSVLDKHFVGDTKKLGDYTYSELINALASSGLLI